MSQLTKQQLTVENNSSFPNNNTGFITPELLRTFNQDMIDSTVNQTVYTTDSASFDSRINSVTGSSIPAGTISSSAQVVAALPSNVVSSSIDTSTIDLTILSGAIRATARGGIVSGSSQVSSITGSSLITASFDNNSRNLQFTKGDNSTFNVNIPDASGSSGIDTGSFAVTGSNIFLGNQTITGSLSVSSSSSPGIYFKVGNGGVNSGLQIAGRVDVNGPLNTQNVYSNTAYINQINRNGPGDLEIGSNLRIFDVNNNPALYPVNLIVSGNADISSSFSASLQQGYVWVGDGNNRTKTVPTSSFGGGGSTDTGSLMVTGSVNVNVLTFTKGDGSTFDLTVSASGSAPAGTVSGSQQIIDLGFVTTSSFQSYTSSNDGKVNTLINATGSYATTGSNIFIGNQFITGSIFQSGNNNNILGPGQTFFSGSVIISSSAAFDLMVTGGIDLQNGPVRVQSANGTGSFGGTVLNLIDSGSSTSNTRFFQTTMGRAYISFFSSSIGNVPPYNVVSVFAGRSSIGGFTQATAPAGGGIAVNSGSAGTLGSGYYYPIQFQASNAYTDGRTTFGTPVFSSVKLIGSGSTELTGSVFIQSSSANLPESTGSGVLTYDQSNGQVKFSQFTNLISASLSCGEFWSTTTQSGSAGVSGSVTFNNSGSVFGVNLVSGSRLTIVNPGTFNIQFSAQIESSAGSDTQYIWFRKNGTNIADSATKVVLANNTAQVMTVNILDTAVQNDYYELVHENKQGNATILYEPASGSVPAIPSVIATVTQVK
jgi:hypothetical protein